MALAVFSCKCYSILTWNEQSEFGVYKKKTKEKVDWLVSIFNFFIVKYQIYAFKIFAKNLSEMDGKNCLWGCEWSVHFAYH